MKKILISLFIGFIAFTAGPAQGQEKNEFNASYFGCISDGQTDNTSSIQKAIDFISENGGGKLKFYVGRYLTGGLDLKSNVTIVLNEGAVLVASPVVNDYLIRNGARSLLFGEGVSNFKITGKGVIEAYPIKYNTKLDQIKSRGILPAEYLNIAPSLLTMVNSRDIIIEGIIIQDAIKDGLVFKDCQNVDLSHLILRYNQNEKGAGITLENTVGVGLDSLYVETRGTALVKDKQSQVKGIKHSIKPNGKSIL